MTPVRTRAALTATFEVDEPVGDGYVLRYVERFARGEVDVPLSVS